MPPCTYCSALGRGQADLVLNDPCTKLGRSPCELCVRLKELDQQVSEAKRSLEFVLEKRRELMTAVNEHHDPFIHHLPPEIASRIFHFCLPRLASVDIFNDVDAALQVNYANRPIPFILGSVCRYWRKIAWSMPQLWNILWLQVTPGTTNTVARSQLLNGWLGRSGQLPLFIRVFVSNAHCLSLRPSTSSLDLIDSIIDTLSNYADRWKVVDLSLPASSISRLRNNCSNTSTILDVLNINVSDSGPPRIKHDAVFDLSAKPSPKQISIAGFYLEKINIYWSNITCFDGALLFREEVLTILRLAPAMEQCKLSCITEKDYFFSTPSCELAAVHVHHSLRTLITRNVTSKFWSQISCPALEDLSCHLAPQSVTELVSFIVRSSCPLRSLTLDDFKGGKDMLTTIIKSAPSHMCLSLH